MTKSQFTLTTDDGECPTYVFRPPGTGPWPAVIFFMDGLAIRPALFEMGERMASLGYYVILPDLFYRAGPYEPIDAKAIFANPELRAKVFGKFFPTASRANTLRDIRAVLAYLAAQPDVKQPHVGATGYCMGAVHALAAAGEYPDRIVAAAGFHPGNIATDAADSGHLYAAKAKGRLYVAGAIEDPTFPDEMKARLEAALTAGGVDHTIETYPAKHGWVPSDTPVHDPVCAERHWKALESLFAATLS